jgi:hypothetical protein
LRLLSLRKTGRTIAFVLFNLGAIAVERRQWPKALGFLEGSLLGSAPTDSIVRKLFALIARAHQDDARLTNRSSHVRQGAEH